MSTTQEFYIRTAGETDARGPFTLEQLGSLAENGQVGPDSYYYDAAAEAWALIRGNPGLHETLFPPKKHLRIRPKPAVPVANLNATSAADRPITVDDMLLAAEGRTPDTKDKADPAIARGRSALVGLYAAMVILFVSAGAYILPHIDVLLALDLVRILREPLLLLGLLNLVIGLCLALGAVGAYPAARFAAMLGFGFTGALFYLQEQPLALACAGATGLGLFCCTILLSLPAVALAALLGLAGACGVAHHLFTS